MRARNSQLYFAVQIRVQGLDPTNRMALPYTVYLVQDGALHFCPTFYVAKPSFYLILWLYP